MNTLRSLTLTLLAGEIAARPWRALVGVLAIAIGVAMGYAVQLINHAALTEFSRTAGSLMGNADLEIRGPRGGFDETLYPRLARLPQVAAASPVVEVEAWLPAQHQPLKLLGVDVFRAAQVTPGLVGRPADSANGRLDLLSPDALFLSPAALAALGLPAGSMLTVQSGLQTLQLRIAGTLPTLGAGLRLGVMDIGAAQWRLDRLGLLQRIDLRLTPGVDAGAFARSLRDILPAGVVAATPRDTLQGTASLSRAYRVNLNVLALVALFTGAFLVFSTQALSVLRRRSQLALLRALGMTRRELLRLLLIEGATQGGFGALLGLGLGFTLASAALRYTGGDLGGGYFDGVRPSLHLEPLAALLFLALGILAATLGSLLPAWEAAHARPPQALKAGDEEVALQRLHTPWTSLAMVAGALLLTQAGPVGDLPVLGYLAIALLLVGAIIAMPQLAQAVFGRLPAVHQLPVQLAFAQLAGASGRAAIGLAGILASFSLMASMVIMVASFRQSVDDWLGAILPAPLYLRATPGGEAGYFGADAQQRISTTPGVARAEFLRTGQLLLSPSRPAVALLARQVDPHHPGRRLPLVGLPLAPGPEDPPPAWVSEAMVDLYGFRTGRLVALPIAGRPVTFLVAGVWRDYARQYGAVVMQLNDYRRLTHDNRVSDAALWLAPDATPTQVAQRLRRRLTGGEQVQYLQPNEIHAVSLGIFDRSFAITYLLEAVAVLVGVCGIAASFSAQALARTREFGVLRHLGVTQAQISAMLALEGGLLALLGVCAGLLLGWAIALILIRVVNPQSFHWSMDLMMPWRSLALLAAALIIAAALTALLSGRRAMSGSAVRAVKEDW